MNRRNLCALALCAGVAVILSSCRTEGPAASQADSTAAPSAGTAPGTQPTGAQWTWSGYTAPSPMPPEEGTSSIEGRMLWPTLQETGIEQYDGMKYKFGFIDEAGKKIAPGIYIKYDYETDGEGRYEYLVASTGRRVDIYAMDGRKVLELEAEEAGRISGTDYVLATVTGGHYHDMLDPSGRYTVYSMKTGERLLTGDYCRIHFLSSHTVLLTDKDYREYLCDLRRGEGSRVPLAGYAQAVYPLFADDGEECRIGGSTAEPYWYTGREPGPEARYGYMGTDGKWVLEPVYLSVTSFIGQHAAVEAEDDTWYFIDRQGRRAGTETYEYIQIGEYGDVRVFSLPDGRMLDANLEPYSAASGEMTGWFDGAVYYKGEPVGDVPAQYSYVTYAEWPVMILSSPLSGDNPYWINMQTREGHVMEQRGWSIYKMGDRIYKSRGEDSELYDHSGKRVTGTAVDRYPSIGRYIYDWNADMTFGLRQGYLWAATAQYQGYMNLDGRWLYRESRYSDIVD